MLYNVVMTDTNSLYTMIIIITIILTILETLPSVIINWSLVGKAGMPGWSQLIPFYSTIVRAKIINSLGMAIGSMIFEIIGTIVTSLALLVWLTDQQSVQAEIVIYIGVALLFVGGLLNFILRMKFGSRFVVINPNGQTNRLLRWRASFLTLFSLKYIKYNDGTPALADAPKIIGYDKADYVPTGFDQLAIIAGWVGAFSFPILIPAPVALILGIVALKRIRQHPELKGRGRAWFATIWGLLWSLALVFVIYYVSTHPSTNS